MTNDEAKFILSAYRPNGRDAQDPVMAEALEQAARDPELAEWFRRERELDVAISERLSQVAVPPSLRSNILAGHRMMVSRPASRPWWSRALSWAAAVVLFVGLAAFWGQRTPEVERSFALYRSDMTNFLEHELKGLDFRAPAFSEVSAWLVQERGMDRLTVPADVQSAPTMGCRILDWNGAEVTLVCFSSPSGELTHLVVVDRSALNSLLPGLGSGPDFQDGWTTVSWEEGDRVYLLAGKGDRPAIAELL